MHYLGLAAFACWLFFYIVLIRLYTEPPKLRIIYVLVEIYDRRIFNLTESAR